VDLLPVDLLPVDLLPVDLLPVDLLLAAHPLPPRTRSGESPAPGGGGPHLCGHLHPVLNAHFSAPLAKRYGSGLGRERWPEPCARVFGRSITGGRLTP